MQTDGKMEGFHPQTNGPTMEEFEGGMHFTPIDLKRSFPTGVTGSELTKYALDKSHLLTRILSSCFENQWKDILGELELSFITFLIGQNFCGLEQWKKIIILLCGCCEAIKSNSSLFKAFSGNY